MVDVSKEMSQKLGHVVSSPFVQILAWGLYDYDDLVGEEGFASGWEQRAIAAGAIENLSEKDKAFYDICMKSRDLTTTLKVGNPLDHDDLEKIRDTLINLEMIDFQILVPQD